MTDAPGHSLVEVYVNAMELMGTSLRVIEALPRGDPIADALLSVCPQAVLFCRAFRRDEPEELPFRIDQVRQRFLEAEVLLRRLRARGGSSRPHVTAGIEIAERGRAARTGRSLQEYLRSRLAELAAKPDPEALVARIRERKDRTETRLSRESILAHRDVDRT